MRPPAFSTSDATAPSAVVLEDFYVAGDGKAIYVKML